MANGLIDADLGGNLVKKRVALPGRGKRGSARTIVATKMADRWFFMYGFSKNERANIEKDELKFLQAVAKELLEYDNQQILTALTIGEIIEVFYGGNKT